MSRLKRRKYKITSYYNYRGSYTGCIMLLIQLVPKKVKVMTYVIDKKLPYDRPWIHPMRCIPSTLHRILKFNHER